MGDNLGFKACGGPWYMNFLVFWHFIDVIVLII
jgi:hypothetical protein